MKAPEKLYFAQTEDGTHYYTPAIPFEREHVEYTRTDAFIEKACEWMDSVLKANMGYYAGSQAIEDFKKYMKG